MDSTKLGATKAKFLCKAYYSPGSILRQSLQPPTFLLMMRYSEPLLRLNPTKILSFRLPTYIPKLLRARASLTLRHDQVFRPGIIAYEVDRGKDKLEIRRVYEVGISKSKYFTRRVFLTSPAMCHNNCRAHKKNLATFSRSQYLANPCSTIPYPGTD